MGNWIIVDTPKEDAPATPVTTRPQQKENPQKQKSKKSNFVILDRALWKEDIEIAFSMCDNHTCLFATRGADHELDNVAPYLFEYNGNEKWLRWIKKKQEKGKRVLYLTANASLEELRKHIRRFLRVKSEDNKWLFFRIYDPEVVNCVFPNLKSEQLKEFFSIVTSVVTENYRMNERRLLTVSEKNELIITYSTLD